MTNHYRLPHFYKLILLFALLVTNTLTSHAIAAEKKFYISPQGNDKQQGTRRAPWKTTAYALTQCITYLRNNPHSHVKLMYFPGNYTMLQAVEIDGKGIEGTLSIEAIETGKTIIDCSTSIQHFEEVKPPHAVRGKLLRAKLPTNITLNPIIADDNRLELYHNGSRLQPARYPNNGFIKTGALLSPITEPDHSAKEGRFCFTDKRLNSLANEKEAWLLGFWCYNWADSYQRVESVDTQQQSIMLASPRHHYGYREGANFYAVHGFEYLDSLYEYYLDRENRYIYWVSKKNEKPSRLTLKLSNFKDDYCLRISNFNQFTIKGLTFLYGNRALLLQDCNNSVIAECKISCMASDAMHIQGGRQNTVKSCFFSHIGVNGIIITGGNRKTLEAANDTIHNNIFTDISYYLNTFQRAITFTGCGITITNNAFTDMPTTAIEIAGNDVVVKHNLFRNLVCVSDDQGAIDMYNDPSFRGVIIKENYWSNIGGADRHKVAAVRLDDLISGIEISGNFFEKCGSSQYGAVEIHGGKDNIVKANTFNNCPLAMSFHQYGDYWKTCINSEDIQKKIYKDVNINSELYQKSYPSLRTNLLLDADRNFIEDNILANCTRDYLYERTVNQFVRNQKTSTPTRPRFSYGPKNNPYERHLLPARNKPINL